MTLKKSQSSDPEADTLVLGLGEAAPCRITRRAAQLPLPGPIRTLPGRLPDGLLDDRRSVQRLFHRPQLIHSCSGFGRRGRNREQQSSSG